MDYILTTMITKQDIYYAQSEWANAIIKIGQDFKDGKDYKETAKIELPRLYSFDYNFSFKPTLASVVPFRKDFDETLSYFVGGIIPEDMGFALRPWKQIVFNNHKIMLLSDNFANVIGEYVFIDVDDKKTFAEYTFGYEKKSYGTRIFLHHSSLRYDKSR